jgi:hypothetical protein
VIIRRSLILSALVGLFTTAALHAQVGFGVDNTGQLFRFNLTTPNNPVQSVGNLGFVPEGIDFRPGSTTLFAIDIGTSSTQLYTVNLDTGAATTVGASFPSSGSVSGINYNLTASSSFGFDFNPTTLQGDNSMRIRLVGTGGVNLRLNSSTGQIAAVDGSLAYAAGDPNAAATPRVSGGAYINSNRATAGGATTLYDMDFALSVLATQVPPNNGTLNTVGAFGATIQALDNIGFDILTDPTDVDPGIGGDTGFAVYRRSGVSGDNYLLYNVNLGTGATTSGALVGSGSNFDGGFAVIAAVPEPSTIILASMGGLGIAALGYKKVRRRFGRKKK